MFSEHSVQKKKGIKQVKNKKVIKREFKLKILGILFFFRILIYIN